MDGVGSGDPKRIRKRKSGGGNGKRKKIADTGRKGPLMLLRSVMMMFFIQSIDGIYSRLQSKLQLGNNTVISRLCDSINNT